MSEIRKHIEKEYRKLVKEYYIKNFSMFYDKMITFMADNHEEKGDSFITCNIEFLINALLDCANDISTCKMNNRAYDETDFINIANFSAMINGRHCKDFIKEKDFINTYVFQKALKK